MDNSVKNQQRIINSQERAHSKFLQVTADLNKQRKLYQTINLSSLPDKGAKLKCKIDELETLLKDLTLSKPNCTMKVDCNEKQVLGEQLKKNISGHELTENIFSHKNLKGNDINISSNDKISENSKNDVSSCTPNGESHKSLDGVHCESSNSNSADNKKHSPFSKPLVCTSFEALNSKAKIDSSYHKEDILDSPSFKTYRNTEAIPSIKLTEAKPLFVKDSYKKYNSAASCKGYPNSLVDEETMKQMHSCMNIYPESAEEEIPPLALKTTLMKHQIQALSWLMWRELQTLSGGILADDMGLGKTLTMIALILKQRENNNFSAAVKEPMDRICKGTLIVCVASVVHQWEDEIIKHCKKHSLTVLLYHGPKRERDENFMQRQDVVLTTYNIVLSEKKALAKGKSSGLFMLKWERIILDEAHTIKNHSSQTAEAVFSLKGFKKWCMTGTPIHNDFKDLYSLLKFLNFIPFNDFKTFKKLTDEKGKYSTELRNMLVKSILLRRTKEDKDESDNPLVEMKTKTSRIIYIDLSNEEKQIYEDLSEKANNIIEQYFQSKHKPFRNSSCLLTLLLRLQQCCSHVSLLGMEPEENMDDSLSNIEAELSSLSLNEDSGISSFSESKLDLTFSKYESRNIYDRSMKSTKIQKLFEELDRIAEESNNQAKSVIVSQWVSMLELIEIHLKREGKQYHMITGSTKAEDRQKFSEDLNINAGGCKIMLLSLKAGGVGLNLIGASHLFLLDLHWNPALEQQACDRIHRVGQKNDVFIHKFVCSGTIEQRILDLQEKKSSLASDVLTGAGKIKKGLSMEDFKSLFDFKN